MAQRYGKRIDVWASGIIMHMILTGKHPFFNRGDSEKTYIQRITNDNLESLVTDLSPLAHSLFWRLCSKSTSERYTVATALKHPWITRNPYDKVPLT